MNANATDPLHAIFNCRRGILLTGAVALLACVSLPDSLAFSQESATSPVPTVRSSRKAEVLLLKSGNITEGLITQESGGYIVQKPTGRFLVPFDLVRFKADNRLAIYERLRDSLENPQIPQHLQLARWCLTWNLYEPARDQLQAVLEADVNNREARDMLVKLNSVLGATAETKPVPKPTADGFKARPARSLAGLSRENASHFVTRVQPILVSRCANAGCHGGSDPETIGEFQLSRTRVGGAAHRIHAERNLAAVLNQIDLEHPDRSPLLAVAAGSHGRDSRAVFSGVGGKQNLEYLTKWVADVAVDLRAQESDNTDSDDPFRKPRPGDKEPSATALLLSANKDAGGPAVPIENGLVIQGRPDLRETPEQMAKRRKDDLLQEILRSERPDAFDPDIFNRKYHANSTGSSR